ncbi:MAG TPA: glycoside hydrolase family 3 N-terminal domain-containing protein [Candidatus Acidoferrales bacterium]|nr:glycoside hydrolase family 3 N-terminal domain-containing protein [Candidatus Acidoferrales bacterium]
MKARAIYSYGMQASTRRPWAEFAHKFGPFAMALVLPALFSLMTPSARAQKSSRAKTPPAASSKWVEQTLKKMTLREKLGQMLMVTYFGVFKPADSPEFKELLHQVDDNRVGGLIIVTDRGPLGLERSQVYPTAVITNELQRRSKIPLLIGADFESGTGMRLDEGTSFPSAMAIGATGDPKLAYAAGKYTALEARAAGVQWIFAPDADVNNNPDNPIINVRSFGEDPKDVAAYAREFVRGVEENGALATAKHFPGHGDVGVDSHISLPVVPGDRQELETTELVPFRAAIDAGVSSIMPGHLSVPALEPNPQLPATLSRNILTAVLRDELKFRGLVITDALDMGAVTSLYTPGEAAVRSVEAGADVLLMSPTPDAALAGLEDAVRSGRISKNRIDDSVRRILAAKARLGLDRNRFVDVGRLNEKFARPEYEDQAQAIADRGVTLLRDTQHLLPLDSTRPLRVLLVALSADADPVPGETIEPEIRPLVDSLTVLRADTQYFPVSALKLPSPDSYDVAIAALFVRVADRKGDIGFPDQQRAFVNQLIAAGKPTVVASFGSPYLIERFPNAKTWVAEFSFNDVSQRAVAHALFGQTGIAGKIPVTVPGVAQRGDGLQLPAIPTKLQPAPRAMSDALMPVYALLNRAVSDGAFPGGVLAVGWKSQLALHPFGQLEQEGEAYDVDEDSMYDVASLTKPIVTTTAAMLLVQQDRLDLDLPVERYLPEFAAAAKSDPNASWRAHVTVRMLLLHDPGLPDHRDFYKEAKGHDAILARVLAEPLISEPGTHIQYSDVGLILLGEIIQRLTGQSLDAFAKQSIFSVLGMDRSMFNPPRRLRQDIAPTEMDSDYRKRMVWGEVHDENAWAMGGVAGHAGLFSTAPDIAVFAQMILNGGIYGHDRLLSRAVVRQFTTRVTIGDSARTLGWDIPTEPSSSGRYFSAASFGHTGFTGTSLWIDPQRKLFVVLLTNRVHPTRSNEKIRQIRPALHDAIFESLGLATSQAAAR